MKNHNIPTWTPAFEPAWTDPEIKKIQSHNRDFEVGDSVCLWERNPFAPQQYYTGRHVKGVITDLKYLGDDVMISISITHRESSPDYTEIIP